MLKDIFRFSELQERGICGFGYRLTITRSSDNSGFKKAIATVIDKIKV